MYRFNNRPRKSLGMPTPNQVLCGIMHDVAPASESAKLNDLTPEELTLINASGEKA